MKVADCLAEEHQKLLALLKNIEDGSDPVPLIRALAHNLAAQIGTIHSRQPSTERSTPEGDPDGGDSKSHGYGAAHGGPTGPDDAPAIPDPKPGTQVT